METGNVRFSPLELSRQNSKVDPVKAAAERDSDYIECGVFRTGVKINETCVFCKFNEGTVEKIYLPKLRQEDRLRQKPCCED